MWMSLHITGAKTEPVTGGISRQILNLGNRGDETNKLLIFALAGKYQ
jgi:hypothetical protein